VFSEKHDDMNKEFPALAKALEKFQKSVNLNAG
jgi:hypothetical protein